MIFSDWLRGLAQVALKDVNNVFSVARTAVAAAPFLPANIKTDTTNLLNDAQSDLTSLEGLAGTLAGNAVADGIDDTTTLVMNTANALTGSKSPADFSAAEKTVLAQAWTAMKAQGDTLISQFMAGVDPTAPAPASVVQPQAQPATSV